MNRELVAGDLLFGIAGDARAYVPALVAVEDSVIRAVRQAMARGMSGAAARRVGSHVGRNAVRRIRRARTSLARRRIDALPPNKAGEAKRAIQLLLDLPIDQRIAAVRTLLRDTSFPTDDLQAVADAAFAGEGYDLTVEGVEVGQDEEVVVGYMPVFGEDGTLIGWNPLKSVAKAVKKVGKAATKVTRKAVNVATKVAVAPINLTGKVLTKVAPKPLKKYVKGVTKLATAPITLTSKVVSKAAPYLTAGALVPGAGMIALGVKNRKKIAKVAKPLVKVLGNKKVLALGAAGLTVLCPPAGGAALAALALSGKVVGAINAASSAVRGGAKQIVTNTARQAIQKRDPAAIKALGMQAFWARYNAHPRRGKR